MAPQVGLPPAADKLTSLTDTIRRECTPGGGTIMAPQAGLPPEADKFRRHCITFSDGCR
jgi:hypothetical protein